MELPHLGEHCQESTCKILDFLPFKCDSCKKVFCKDHIHYFKHSCDQSTLRNKDFQVPLCPLCNQPVPYKRNEVPDITMSAHIDRDCKSDPAEERRKVFSNKCSLKGCKQKELIPFTCQRCKKNYCIRHRHETDHSCDDLISQARPSDNSSRNTNQNDLNSKRLLFFQKQQEKQTSTSKTQSKSQLQPRTMSEAEELEYAIKLSLKQSSKENKETRLSGRQLTEDEELAKALAESELENRNKVKSADENKETCSIN